MIWSIDFIYVIFVFDIKDRWYIGYSNQTIKIVDSIVDISCKPASKILSLENKAGKFLFWAKLVLQFLIYKWKIDSRNLRTSQFGPKAKKTSHDWERSGRDWDPWLGGQPTLLRIIAIPQCGLPPYTAYVRPGRPSALGSKSAVAKN